MTFTAPTQDISFVLHELLDLPALLQQPLYQDIEADVVHSVLQENARFVQELIAPLNSIGDRQPPTLEQGQVTMPEAFNEAYAQFVGAGWQGIGHAAEVGGHGFPQMVAAAVNENLHAGSMAFALCPMLTDGVIRLLTEVGTPQQQELYLPALLTGRWSGTMNLTEPQAGTDLAAISTRAVRQDDGTYRLKGQKIFITYGEHDLAENIVHLVLARTPDAPAGVRGLSLFMVPKFLPTDAGELGPRNDVFCASLEGKLGIHSSPTAVLLYGDGQGEVGSDGAVGYLVGEEQQGLRLMFIMMNAARYAVGLQGVAVSEAAYQQALSYAQERVQSRSYKGSAGPVAIIAHPDVQRMLSTMRAYTEGCRALAYFTAQQFDLSLATGAVAGAQSNQDDLDAAQSAHALYDFLVPVVKGFSTEVAQEVCSLAIQVHGGMGYIEETGVAQYYRDARILPIYEGTTAIQANDLINRKLLLDDGAVARNLLTQMQADAQTLIKQFIADNGGQARQVESAASPLRGEQAKLQQITTAFTAALTDYEQAVDFMLARAQDNRYALYASSVPFLHLVGTVVAGWLMLRAANICAQKIAAGTTDVFYQDKLNSCVAYAVWVLPKTQALFGSIQGSVALSDWLD